MKNIVLHKLNEFLQTTTFTIFISEKENKAVIWFDNRDNNPVFFFTLNEIKIIDENFKSIPTPDDGQYDRKIIISVENLANLCLDLHQRERLNNQ